MMSQAISEFLTNGQDLQRQLINHPRWGNELEMELQPTYFAASGRYCRPFILYPQDGEAQHRLACKQSANQWEEARLVTGEPQ